MGRRQLWTGEKLRDLFELSLEELEQKYGEDRGKLRALKSYHRRKAERMEQEGRLYKTWEVSAFNHQTGEWETTTNHGYEYGTDPSDLAETFEPATPAKITPTKRRRAAKLGRQLLVFGDSQIGYHRVYDEEGNDELIPIHSEEALSVIQQVNAHEQPDEIVNLSDTIDLAELGRFDPKSDSFHRTLGPSFQRVHDFYAQLRADNPTAKITEVDSNHNARTQKAMMKRYPEWYGFRLPGEDYPLMSYYRLANLAELDINWISGYGQAEYEYGDGDVPIIFKHGIHSSSAPGATVRKEAQNNPMTHIVRGHGHSHEHITQTDRHGRNHHYIQLGTTCCTTGNTPSYKASMDDFGHPVDMQENWQNNFMMITDNEDGTFQFDVVDIIDGIATYRNQRYDGNK